MGEVSAITASTQRKTMVRLTTVECTAERLIVEWTVEWQIVECTMEWLITVEWTAEWLIVGCTVEWTAEWLITVECTVEWTAEWPIAVPSDGETEQVGVLRGEPTEGQAE